MADFLEGLNEIGATINAPFKADPNLNLAGLLLGAGLLQPVQPGQTAAGTAGQALVGSLDFLTKQRSAQAKMAQERDIEAAKVGAFKEKTQAELEQGRTQFTARESAEQRRHEEVISRLNQQYQLALAAKQGDKLRDRGNIAKMGYDSADAFVEAYPDNFLGADGKSIDRRKVDIFRTIQSNRMLRQFGHEPQDYLPYGSDDVNAVAQLARTNPSLYQVRIGDLALVFGPKFQEDVTNAVMQAPTAATTTPGATKTVDERSQRTDRSGERSTIRELASEAGARLSLRKQKILGEKIDKFAAILSDPNASAAAKKRAQMAIDQLRREIRQ